ncbi:AAA family ATPase [Bacillus inaquosorum]|uniref:AAA family ATPase n=1 Tax=Bacillus inaquosorum TaxID=483913 RepID=UPI00227E7784|nr:AAA family ATPase [Bacillus inaquosorum]MCY7757801.1 AAA family ATPase [Bacillus inaquosorum]MCY8731539.1 AAA family ATPase [Bacillus inaquosorum]
MARKFGKKNKIKVSPLDYNIGLIGESGIGKTTLAKEVCEKLVGEDGYMILNIGKEDGVDAIPNASYEDVPDWITFNEITKDIIKNRTTDYADLKVLVYDTFDELIKITEPEVIRLHNKANPEKRVNTIKAAFGGFQAGEDKAIELILDKMWELKKVGISMFILGHTKKRTMTDVVTGLEYDMLTTNMTHKYFNAIKTKLHVLGVASINRSIEKKTVKQKIGPDKTIGTVVDESRIITFRDDNFNIDSKSRFSDITPSIALDDNEFIEAIQEAIHLAFDKQKNNTNNFEEERKEQEQLKETKIQNEANNSSFVDQEENEKLADEIKKLFPNASDEAKEKMKQIMDQFKMKDFKGVDTTPTNAFEKIVDALSN